MFGYSTSELVGGSVERLMPLSYQARHHEHLAHFYAAPRARELGFDRGLGLTIVRRLIDFGGGDIRVESGSGKGSTFIVQWPRPEAA